MNGGHQKFDCTRSYCRWTEGPLVEFVMTLKTNLQIFSINKGEEEEFLCIDLTTLARCSPRKGNEEPWVESTDFQASFNTVCSRV
jgi:hypothetical protein